jgi:hypothetical protein
MTVPGAICVYAPLICSHFDLDGDGRVDLLNFLKFFLSKDNKEKRTATRVSHGLNTMRNFGLSMQKDKLKASNTDKVDRQVMMTSYCAHLIMRCGMHTGISCLAQGPMAATPSLLTCCTNYVYAHCVATMHWCLQRDSMG